MQRYQFPQPARPGQCVPLGDGRRHVTLDADRAAHLEPEDAERLAALGIVPLEGALRPFSHAKTPAELDAELEAAKAIAERCEAAEKHAAEHANPAGRELAKAARRAAR